MENKEITENYRDSDEYKYLVEHCNSILKERIKRSREEVILAHLEVGEEICQNPIYKKWGKGNRKFLLQLFVDIGIGERSGDYSIEGYKWFVKKFGELDVRTACEQLKDTLKEGDNLSWNKIKQLYLPKIAENKIKIELPKGKYDVIYAAECLRCPLHCKKIST